MDNTSYILLKLCFPQFKSVFSQLFLFPFSSAHVYTEVFCAGLYLYNEPPGCLHSISQMKCTLVLL